MTHKDYERGWGQAWAELRGVLNELQTARA
jgi:hypothetical protein